MVSFVWVAWFSFIISTVVERWVHLGLSNGSSLGGEWFGLVLISIGAEIPGMLHHFLTVPPGAAPFLHRSSTHQKDQKTGAVLI